MKMNFCRPAGVIVAMVLAWQNLFVAQAADDPATLTEMQAQFPSLLADLDSPQFETRSRAAEALSSFADRQELKSWLAGQIAEALRSTELSFEARIQLTALARRLPNDGNPTVITASKAEIERLVEQLDDDSAAIRDGAQTRLAALAGQQATNLEVLSIIKQHLTMPSLDVSTRNTLRELYDGARGTWLLSDPASWRLPDVSDHQISAWVDLLARPITSETWIVVAQEAAQRELTDLLARQEYVERVRAALEKRLNQTGLDADTAKRLESIYDWTKPAMVAEYWTASETRPGVTHTSIQYILVDVPSVPWGGTRATHFDRVDDSIAHCASGNSLSPGDYPIGVYIPHPQTAGAQFHLINLPTPLRRFRYEYEVRIDEVARYRQITRRTLDRILAQKLPLSQAEILMLEELDDGQVSEFTGKYLMTVDDSRYPPPEAQFVGNLSRHLNLCCMLARSGRHEAIPGLMKAIKAQRFLEAPPETPYNWPWVAVLCVAIHDPWPEVDQFLADLIEREQPLMRVASSEGQIRPVLPMPQGQTDIVPEPRAPDLGATAASLLLARHGIPPSVFGLEVLMYSPLVSFDCPGSYFPDEKDRARVLEWWKKQKSQQATAP